MEEYIIIKNDKSKTSLEVICNSYFVIDDK